jgi:hypothetical protein
MKNQIVSFNIQTDIMCILYNIYSIIQLIYILVGTRDLLKSPKSEWGAEQKKTKLSNIFGWF